MEKTRKQKRDDTDQRARSVILVRSPWHFFNDAVSSFIKVLKSPFPRIANLCRKKMFRMFLFQEITEQWNNMLFADSMALSD